MNSRIDAGARHERIRRAWLAAGLFVLVAPLMPEAAAQSCPISPLTGAPACDAAPDPGSNPLPAGGEASAHHVGNPIEAIGGNKHEAAVDFRSIASPLAFVRHCNSALSDANAGLGRGWRHGYQASMARVDASRVVIVQGNGRTVAFDRVAPTAAAPERYVGVLAGDGHVDVGPGGAGWHLPDGRVLRFRGAWLVAVEGEDDLALHYAGGRLASVRSRTGLELRLEWQPGSLGLASYGADPSRAADEAPPGHLAALVLPDGSRVEYAYSGARTLVAVRRDPPEGRTPAGRAVEGSSAGRRDRATAACRYEDPFDGSLLTGATR